MKPWSVARSLFPEFVQALDVAMRHLASMRYLVWLISGLLVVAEVYGRRREMSIYFKVPQYAFQIKFFETLPYARQVCIYSEVVQSFGPVPFSYFGPHPICLCRAEKG